jgi:hypothetical protein
MGLENILNIRIVCAVSAWRVLNLTGKIVVVNLALNRGKQSCSDYHRFG